PPSAPNTRRTSGCRWRRAAKTWPRRRAVCASTTSPRHALRPEGLAMGFCPECGTEYEPAVAACPRCRVVLTTQRPVAGTDPVVVHRVPDAAAGALLGGLLEHHGIRAVLRSAMLPGYGTVRRDWSTTAWGEILVPAEEAEE